MPWPTSAGVLGMARITRSVPSQAAMLPERMPAATLRCSAPGVWARVCRGRFAEGLGLDGPDDQAGAFQRRHRLFADGDLELLGQPGALLGKRLDHLDLAGGQAALEQPADDGAGHVAAADEGDVFAAAAGGWEVMVVCSAGKTVGGWGEGLGPVEDCRPGPLRWCRRWRCHASARNFKWLGTR